MKNGRPVKLLVALSYLREQNQVAALVEKVSDDSFALEIDTAGVILGASGEDLETITGYQAHHLVGRNVSVLCPSVLLLVAGSALDHKVSHLVHASGRTVIVSIGRLIAVPDRPDVFSVTIAEVDQSMEGLLTVDAEKAVVLKASLSCPSIFGYETSQLEGMPLTTLFPSSELKKGKRVVVSAHREGYLFYVTADMSRTKDGTYTVVVRHKKVKHATSDLPEEDSPNEIIGWYSLERKARLGKGTCGVVLRGVHRISGVGVAIKVMTKSRFEELELKFPPREIDLMRKMSHPNICRLYNTIYLEDKVYLIMELASDGDLFEYVHERGSLDEAESRHFFRQILAGVEYLHKEGMVHRDLKLENILLHRRQVKLIDVGLGNFFDRSGKVLLETFCGSPDCAAPELFQRKPYYGPMVDIWSLGVILYLMSTPFVPFATPSDTVSLNYTWPKKPAVSAELKHLVSLVFRYANERCSLQVLIDHPWTNDGTALPHIQLHQPGVAEIFDEDVLAEVEDAEGIPVSQVREALLNQEHNQVTATYYLLLRRKTDTSVISSPRRGSLVKSTP